MTQPPKTLLLIDDDDGLRRVVEFNLREDGYHVLTAVSGSDGLRLFQSEAVDVVLSDVRMPEMDGLDLLARLKAVQPDVPVVLLTAHGTVGSAVEAMKLGAFDYLTKPFSRDQLRAAVQKALDVRALTTENRHLRQIVSERFSFASMIAGSRAMRGVTDLAARVAPSHADGTTTNEGAERYDVLARSYVPPSYGCLHVFRACPVPATKASFAALPSRHVVSCMFIVAASVSRRRLLRARSCSNACDRSWLDSMSWRRPSSSPAAILSRIAVIS